MPVTGSTGPITWDDATWILTSAFIIFTMQSGFGLLEAGCVSSKNEVNIMMKNVVDVIFGGITYWAFGFGFSFGNSEGTNPFCGIGYWFVNPGTDTAGLVYSTFVFQLSFATTATTIVSGAMAERTKLSAYIVFSATNILTYCFPAHWMWGTKGFLLSLGAIDFAGSGVVHLVGGASAFVAALMLKPRLGRFDGTRPPASTNQVNSLLGMFMLWWSWLAFNCGSTFGISGGKWQLAAKSTVTTLISSMFGGVVGTLGSILVTKKYYKPSYIVNTVLGSLVSITGICAVVRPWEAAIIGVIGGVVALCWSRLMVYFRIDDPVDAVAIHGACGLWGLLAVGCFADTDPFEDVTMGRTGLFHGGGAYLMGVQTLTAVCLTSWSVLVTYIQLYVIDKAIGLRMSPEDEELGADIVEHGIVCRSGKGNNETGHSSSETNIMFSSRHLAANRVHPESTLSRGVLSVLSLTSMIPKDKLKPGSHGS
ncbi:putative ammonium transporter 3 [Gigantopelta aegis]|uniref:putative ammonium transporter 3 n=1 Tax=Gigantopelta aegis TaxID=1735272 RepID=UPI001B88BFB0|nr:putative ammonium transporter 3 [Gigantopelta aegis]